MAVQFFVFIKAYQENAIENADIWDVPLLINRPLRDRCAAFYKRASRCVVLSSIMRPDAKNENDFEVYFMFDEGAD